MACIRSDASIVRAMHTEGHVAACHTVCMPKRSNYRIVTVVVRRPEGVRRLRREPLLHKGIISARENPVFTARGIRCARLGLIIS